MAKRAYKGKYPNIIRSVSIANGRCVCVTNAGKAYLVKPVTREAQRHVPAVGAPIHGYAVGGYEVTAA